MSKCRVLFLLDGHVQGVQWSLFCNKMPTAHNSMMKQSKYNIWLDPIDGCPLCYNAISGGFAHLNQDAVRLIEKATSPDFTPSSLMGDEEKCFQELLKGQLLVKSNEDELSRLILRNRLSSYGSNQVFSMTILPTLKCNLNCTYCFEAEKSVSMDDDTYSKIKEFTEEKLKNNVKHFAVNWFGGEPLIEYDKIVDLSTHFLEICNKNGISFSADLVSNCVLLDEDKSKQLSKLNVNSVQVTFDGSSEIHNKQRKTHSGKGTFDKILENIEKCSNYLSFAIRVNLSHGCSGWLDQFFSQIKHLAGNNRISLYPGKLLSSTTSACSSIESSCYNTYEFSQISVEFYKKCIEYGFGMHWYPRLKVPGCCATSTQAMTVEPNGSLCRCWSQVGAKGESYGNINNITETFESENYYKWVLYDAINYNDECKNCVFFPICTGGCPAHWIPHTTDYMKGNNDLPLEDKCCSIRYNLKQMLSLVYQQSKSNTCNCCQ